MEEIEVPMEHLHEEINEEVDELYKKKEHWTLGVAISTALMAVCAAVAALMAGHHSNEALIDQIKASDQWAYYQAKSIKAEIRALQPADISKNAKSPEQAKLEQEEIKKKAEDAERSSEFHLKKHIQLARSVTLLQVAIAISAIAILTRKRFMWIGGMLIAAVGVVIFTVTLL